MSSHPTFLQNTAKIRQGVTALAVSLAVLFLTACSPYTTKPTDLSPDPEARSEKITPVNSRYLEELLNAEFILQRKGPNAAFELFYALSQKSNDTNLMERSAHIAVAAKNDIYIERSANLWKATDSTATTAYALKLQVLVKQHNSEATAELLTEAESNNISLQFLPAYLESNLRHTKQLETLENAISQLSSKVRSNQHIQFTLAHLYLLTNQYQAAIASSSQLIAQENIDRQEALYLIVAFSQHSLGRRGNSINTLTTASNLYPNDVRLLSPLVRYLVEHDQLEEATRVYHSATLSHSENLQLGSNFMHALFEYEYFEQALEVSNGLPEEQFGMFNEIQYLTAATLAQLGKKTDAINTMDQVTGPLRDNATHKITLWLYDEGREADINNVVLERTLRENTPEQIGFISLLHEERGNLQLAYDLVKRACRVRPESEAIRYRKALLAERIGDWQTTEKELKALLKKAPENAQFLNALGYTLLTRTPRINEAMQYIEQAYENANHDPAIIDSLGWGHFLKGELEQASYFLKKAWSILPDAEIAAHYGESLWAQRHYQEAIKIWEEALVISPDTPLLRNTIKRFSPSLLDSE